MPQGHLRQSQADVKLDSLTLDPHLNQAFVLVDQSLFSKFSKRDFEYRWRRKVSCCCLDQFPMHEGSISPSNFDGKLSDILATCLCPNYPMITTQFNRQLSVVLFIYLCHNSWVNDCENELNGLLQTVILIENRKVLHRCEM